MMQEDGIEHAEHTHTHEHAQASARVFGWEGLVTDKYRNVATRSRRMGVHICACVVYDLTEPFEFEHTHTHT